jgi:hypothetical protein
MSIYTQKGAPTSTSEHYGQYTLNRAHLVDTTVAAPVAPIGLGAIIALNFGAPSFDEKRLLQQGGGNTPYLKRRNPIWSGTITLYQGTFPTILAQLRGITWGSANDRAISYWDKKGVPRVHWEAVCRDTDNLTPLFSVVIPNMVLDPHGFDNPMDSAEQALPFHSDFPPLKLFPYTEWKWDLFNGNGSTVQFTLSSTPVTLLDSSYYDDYVLDNIALITVKESSGDTGVIQLTGVTYSAGKITFTTAPAAGSKVGVGYAANVAAP